MSRSRSGCLTCKRRHCKCDETKPECLQCLGQGIKCAGYNVVLRWDAGIASRRRYTGALKPSETLHIEPTETTRPRRRTSRKPSSGIVSSFELAIPPERNFIGNTNVPSKPFPVVRSPGPEMPSTLNEAFQTSLQSPMSSLEGFSWAGWTEQDRDLYERSTHLYVSSPDNPSSLFEEYYVRGLHLFRKQLENHDGSINVGVMYAGLFICTLNLFQGTPWSVHLELMMTVYGLGGSLHASAVLDNPETHFPLELMAVMDIPTFVRGRSTTTLCLWQRLRQGKRSNNTEQDYGIEGVTSLPRSLLDIFSSIQTEASESAFISWPGEVGEIPQIHLWEAYRFAGILTGRRLRKDPCLSSLALSTEVIVGRLVAAIDALCDTRNRPEYSHLLTSNSLLYPYVAARLEVAILRHRPSWMESLRRACGICQPYGKTANADNIARMLDEAWEVGDDDYDIDEQAKRRNVEIALF
ncbi:uncharacterized protein CCOS01_15433 [Colletotrichum costaricense]|uniref:Zn(2)-C6 fungal-type domain-containing protein n=1 Tax=Colletotrichum costaricense TaxID=1209916 RepID=A0AAI9YH23_9PEZI|nr:uncharacterized protein CCOS01_15433 [Colletotrichum costaricense]KAK1509339.1 hypothetical protein CCOS01_15433 [Colletotrichum costaricense]